MGRKAMCGLSHIQSAKPGRAEDVTWHLPWASRVSRLMPPTLRGVRENFHLAAEPQRKVPCESGGGKPGGRRALRVQEGLARLEGLVFGAHSEHPKINQRVLNDIKDFVVTLEVRRFEEEALVEQELDGIAHDALEVLLVVEFQPHPEAFYGRVLFEELDLSIVFPSFKGLHEKKSFQRVEGERKRLFRPDAVQTDFLRQGVGRIQEQ